MKRRSFLTKAGFAAAAGAIAAPSLVNAQTPQVKWRLTSAFPKSLDTIFGGIELVAKRVASVTGGRFQIQLFAPGEIVPGGQVLDAVKDGTVEAGLTSGSLLVGKDPAFAFDTAIPFGLNSRQQTAWMMEGGGLQLMRELYADYNIYNIPCGNTGAQMGGWFRKEINTVADLNGLKMRIAGLAGQVMQKLGVVPQLLPGGDVYPALEKGTIDAAEWVGPYDDEKLGFNKVAKYYYYPAWWEGGPQISMLVNMKSWAELPNEFKAALEMACSEAHLDMLAKYDARNPAALKRLVAGGAQLRPFSDEIMEVCYRAANEYIQEVTATNPKFKKIYDQWSKFRDDELQWFGVTENRYDFYMQKLRSMKAKS